MLFSIFGAPGIYLLDRINPASILVSKLNPSAIQSRRISLKDESGEICKSSN